MNNLNLYSTLASCLLLISTGECFTDNDQKTQVAIETVKNNTDTENTDINSILFPKSDHIAPYLTLDELKQVADKAVYKHLVDALSLVDRPKLQQKAHTNSEENIWSLLKEKMGRAEYRQGASSLTAQNIWNLLIQRIKPLASRGPYDVSDNPVKAENGQVKSDVNKRYSQGGFYRILHRARQLNHHGRYGSFFDNLASSILRK